ncbi:uncharacterized protein LOC125500656 [Athalia rosae]|uniref:uncharacterized protein LOC125500656 n=1 Tax=Athalia rosae TaxID=37344 RepID=UPI002034A383|nr:uncharacterized protein LOC125500656 [Athalia rosae]
MQLHLIRFDLFLPLLVSLMIVEALEELSPVSTLTAKPIAMSFERVSSSWARNGEGSDGFHPEFVLKSAEIGGSMSHFDQKIGGPWRRRAVGNRKVSKMTYPSANYSTAKLAEKMAEEALSSREMQNTIKELTSLKGHIKQHVQERVEELEDQMEKISQSTKSTTHSPPKTTVRNKATHKRHRSHAARKPKGHRKPNRKHHRPKHHSKRHYPMNPQSRDVKGRTESP